MDTAPVYEMIRTIAKPGATFNARDVLARVSTQQRWKRWFHEAMRELQAEGVIKFTGEVCVWKRIK
jgi:hypothetical protein